MTLKTKRIIYFSLIIFFVLTAPLILLYAAGFRYNFKKGILQETGALFIESQPQGAQIFINDELQKKTTPVRFTRLLPGEYYVKVIKDGYTSWQKRLPVYAGTTTFFQSIRLFTKPLKLNQLETGQLTNLTLAPNKRKAAFIKRQDNEQVVFWFNLDTDQLITVGKFSEPIKALHWSPQSKKLLIEFKSKLTIIDTLTNSTTNINLAPPQLISKIQWDSLSEDIIYGLNREGLIRLNLVTKEIKLLLAGDILAFFITRETTYWISDSSQPKLLTDSQRGQPPQTLYTFLEGNDFQLYPLEFTSSLIVYNTDNSLVYLFNLTNESNNIPPIILPRVSGLEISPDKQKLLYWNDLEVWVLNLTEKKNISAQLITRISTGINKASWHPDSTYVFFITPEELKIAELANGERNVTTLLESKQIQTVFTNVKEDKLYLLTNLDDNLSVLSWSFLR